MRGGKRHRAFGHVARAHSHEGLEGLTIEAWDGDRFVARTRTGAGGRFIFSFGDHFLRAQFGDHALALTIKVVHHDRVIHEGKPWKTGADEIAFELDLDLPLSQPSLRQLAPDWDPNQHLKVKTVHHPLPNGTLGTIGKPVEIEGPEQFSQTLLRLPYSPCLARGVDPTTAHLFRWDSEAKTLRPVWNSGVNCQLGFAWAKIRRKGVYVVLGLPSDKLLLDALASMAYHRRCDDVDTPSERTAVTRAALAPLVEPPVEAVEELRQLVVRLETDTSIAVPQKDVQRGRGAYVSGITLPQGWTPHELRDRLKSLETPPGGLPEENLFYPPEVPGADLPVGTGAEAVFQGDLLRKIEALDLWKWIDLHWCWPWLFSHDWWMYQANERHSGHAMGWSDIRSTNVHRMINLPATPVAGPVYTKPSIVDGKIYVGTIENGTTGGTLYKIDLFTGHIDGKYETPTLPATYGIRGVGGSPAVVDGRAYFTSVHGRVYCVDTATMTTASPPPPALWITDLKNADLAQNQPLANTEADSWSGPLVVNGNLYVGCGEGETATACGFVYCLDAATGKVKWLFCTNQFQNGVDNQPNVVPLSLIPPPGTLPPGFAAHADPPVRGASVWSSLAYCAALDRVYVGTGNPSPDSPAPNAPYSSGCISLCASTGKFKGFWAPQPAESYWPGDNDIDVPGGPIVYRENGKWLVAIGSKSGAFVILDADTMVEIKFRQILPRRNGDGTAANPGTSLPSVVPAPPPGGSENHYGVYGTPARAGKRLFVSMGSDDGIPAIPDGLGDAHKTPFMRVMDDTNLSDAWPTTTDAFGITRYSNAGPPMYTTSETGLGSAAVVNDVVFACSGLGFGGAPASIYAFDVNTGNPLWQDHSPMNDYCLGAAIYGNYVVIGAGTTVRRYLLRVIRFPWPWPIYVPIPQIPPVGGVPRSISIPASVVRGPVIGGTPGQAGQ
jgi:outer membrane protein assembly factor BamB